jgi:peptidoglycan hydrolase-like protein with peptidoglycan-binding domain
MWCRFGVTITALTIGLASSFVSYESVAARSYTSKELLAFLKGFGYSTGNTLSDPASVKGIREFQQDYKLKADGIPGRRTQNLAAQLVQILQANLNLVVKPKPLLPRGQFYTADTAAAVKQFEKKFNLTQNGVADFPTRLRIDNEARRILKIPITTPSPSTSPSPSPSTGPSTSPSPAPSRSPSPAPSTSISPAPSISP